MTRQHSLVVISSSEQEMSDGSSGSKRSSKRKDHPDEETPHVLASDGGKWGPFVWSYEDEVLILKSLLEYRERNGSLPIKNMEKILLYRQIKKLLGKEFTKDQFLNKVRKMKDRHKKMVAYGSDGSADRYAVFHPHHRQSLLDLCSKLWGRGNMAMGSEVRVTQMTIGKNKENGVLELKGANGVVGKLGEDKKEDEGEKKEGIDRLFKAEKEPSSSSSTSFSSSESEKDEEEEKGNKGEVEQEKPRSHEKDEVESYPFLSQLLDIMEERKDFTGLESIVLENLEAEKIMYFEKRIKKNFKRQVKFLIERKEIEIDLFKFVKEKLKI